MKTQRILLVAVCMLIANIGFSQGKQISGIPVMNNDEYSWCSRQVFEIGADSIMKTFNSYFKSSTEAANKEYRSKSKLLIDELTALISSGSLKAYSDEGNPLPSSEVNNILRKTVMVKDPASQKVVKGLQKQNISSFRIVEDVYINKKTQKFEARIMALLVIAAVYTEEGDMRGTMPLFYVYF